MTIDRRTFLKLSSAVSGSLLFTIALQPKVEASSQGSSFQANVYLRFNSDGTVTYRDTKPEIGQAISTGLAMVVCDELGADWSKFIVDRPSLTNNMETNHSLAESAGSNGMLSAYTPLRQAAANLRHMFIESACDIWGTNAGDCKTENSKVIDKISNRSANFSDLFHAVSSKTIPTDAPLKNKAEFTLIGKSTSILENKDIVLGRQQFAIDVKLDGMVYASIERCPTTDGKLASFDDSDCLTLPDVLQTIEMPAFSQTPPAGDEWQEKYRGSKPGVAVIAKSTWAANKAREALKIDWSTSNYHGYDTERVKNEILKVAETQTRNIASAGKVDETIVKAAPEQTFQGSYYNPYQENAHMEPLNAVADYNGETLTIWAGSQSPMQALGYVSEVTGVPAGNIIFHSMRSGGGFGRRYFYDFVAEAAYLAVKLRKPVKVTWTREDCIKHSKYHLARQDEHTLILDTNNNPLAWNSIVRSGSNYGYMGRNIMLDYYAGATAHRRTQHTESDSLVLYPGSWRSVGAHPEGLARECFIDEVANKLDIDPLELRLQWLSNKAKHFEEHRLNDAAFKRRLERQEGLVSILKKAKATTDWQKPISASSGKGISLSYFYGTYVCQMAYVSIKGGKINIDKIVCLFDCGQVVNPQTVEAQIEGSIIWSLSALINPAIEVEGGAVAQSNFDDYPVIRMDAVPEIEIHILESSRQPNRVGEAAVPDTGPAVLNAIFNATNERIREIPIPERLLT